MVFMLKWPKNETPTFFIKIVFSHDEIFPLALKKVLQMMMILQLLKCCSFQMSAKN